MHLPLRLHLLPRSCNSKRKCQDALFSLLVLGARRPVCHLASAAMGKIIYKGDSISIYSRVSSLLGFLSEGKKNASLRIADIVGCLTKIGDLETVGDLEVIPY